MTPYQRLGRESPDFAHWRLPVAALTGIGGYGLVSGFLVVAAMVLLLLAGVDLEAWLALAGTEIALDHPSVLAFQLLSIALLIPCVLVPVAIFWRRHVGYLHSVAGHLRWRWLAVCVVWGFAVVAASLAAAIALDAASTGTVPRLEPLDRNAAAALAVVVLVVPFQAAAEEYVFRGGLLQLIGSWTRWTFVPVAVTSLLFAAGHLYNVWGLVSVFAFGVIAALMTIRTGGLEAAIALHVANNVMLMTLDIVGLIDSGGEGAGFMDEVVPTVLMCAVFWAVVEGAASRRGLQRRRAPLPALPPVQRFRFVPPPPYVPAAGVDPPARPAADEAPSDGGDPRAGVPGNAPPYPGDPGVWRR